ncbi:uncharacterized protein LOC110035929 [Phalaenopsis equestris]|uniref:uncharacterized protein LOC110035929 n=1 Tax=Phalaenopsis equestris TaxID=78828 RepID=UPI0009E1B298|nr:uncharacterized protein LOC110035929 [Phalaenopsis equestris]
MEEPKKVARRDRKTKAAKEPKEDIESRFLSAKSIYCRCRLSAGRDVLDKVRPTIPEETWTTLEAMNLVMCFDLPPYPQDHILTMHILNCWYIDQTVFILGEKEVRFDANQAVLLIGMPNRGALAYWNKLPFCCVTARQIKSDLVNVSLRESSIPFEELLLKFLVTNLLFPSNNFSVPQELYSFCEDVHSFSSYNWPITVCDFLIEQVNAYTMKIRRNQPLGYINGFVFLLTLWFYERTSLVVPVVPGARLRMLLWPSKVSWNASNIHLAFKRLKPE